MNRRSFLSALAATASGLLLPEPPRVRAYSFMPGEHRYLWDAQRDARMPLHREALNKLIPEYGIEMPPAHYDNVFPVGKVYSYSDIEVWFDGVPILGFAPVEYPESKP